MFVFSRLCCLCIVLFSISNTTCDNRNTSNMNTISTGFQDYRICPDIEKQSSDEFPSDIFSQDERLNGAILLHIFIMIYCFLFIALVCQNYFLPSVFCICEDLKITPDIAAATFMASATSFPEMSVNVIATFVTKSDLGIGTIVGATVCNTLAVAGIAGLAVYENVKLEPYPLLRDSVIHICVLSILAVILLDGTIEWTEAFVLVLSYFIYFFVMLTQKHILAFIRKHGNFTSFLCPNANVYEVNKEKMKSISESVETRTPDNGFQHTSEGSDKKHTILILWSWFTLPARKILSVSIPDCKANNRLYPATFAMCVVWIGVCSYLVCWMVTIFGDTFGINDQVMGMVFLAICGSIPEASSAFINARNGIGTMSVSNTLGANTLDILLSLGMPWLVKCSLPVAYGGGPIELETEDLEFNCIGLITAIVLLNVIALSTGYNMNRVFGVLCLLSYFIMAGVFVLVGLHVITVFGNGNTTC